MSDDLVKRLRDNHELVAHEDLYKAADEIERLRAALRKIAGEPDSWSFRFSAKNIARAALGEKKDG